MLALLCETGPDIEHVWHEDRGFRKCEILNRAILAASADYLIFTDGDTIPADSTRACAATTYYA